jgi:hypothetical protein
MHSLMAQSQVPLSLVAPTDRHSDLRPPGRKSLSDFDHATPNYVRRLAIAEATPGVEFGCGTGSIRFFHKLINIDQRLRNRDSMLLRSLSSSSSAGD